MTIKDKKRILEEVRFDDRGLVPAIVQDSATREVLMMAYMNEESLNLTLDKGETYFYSRSRGNLWHKGETSGNVQSVRKVRLDCDCDTVLIEVSPAGPACHTGTYSCFGVEPQFEGFLAKLFELIENRKEYRPQGSYTTHLFDSGLDKILKKIGEESTETVIASKNPDTRELVAETSDLIYHLMVLLVERGVSLDEITRELNDRHASKSGRS
jgi:phosphoribosyl-ATP pyrophosphohydrolase/phosphoribosyl-AMP cyclohydrolase